MISLQEVKDFLKQGTTEIKAYLVELITPETLTAYVATDAGSKWLTSKNDYAVSKGIATYKEKTLPGLIQEGISKALPNETEEQKKLRNISDELQSEKKLRLRGDLKQKAITDLAAVGLSADIADFVVGSDLESTTSNIVKLNEVWNKSLSEAVEKKLATSGRTVVENQIDSKNLDSRIKEAETKPDNGLESIHLKSQKFFGQK